MKKFGLIFIGIMLFVLICVTSGICDTKKPELTVWMSKTYSSTVNDSMAERAQEFATKNNIDLNFVLIPDSDLYPKWNAAIESGQTPDVSYFAYKDIGEFYAKGLLMDLTALSKKIEKEQGAFLPNITAPTTFKGKRYGIPLWVDVNVLIYRKDLLKAAGFTNPPQTWAEFRKIAKATTDPGKGIYGAGVGYGIHNFDCELFTRTVIASFGGSEVAGDGKKVTIDSPQTVKAAQFLADIYLVDKSNPPDAVTWDGTGNNKAYLSGQAAMIYNVGTILLSLKKDNPELYAKTGVALTPAGPAGRCSVVGTNHFGIFKNTKNPELAKDFIAYCLDKNWYQKWVEKGVPYLVPVYQGLENGPVWQDPMNKPFIEHAKYLKYLGYKGPFTPAAGEVFNANYYADAFQRILVEKWAPKKAIKELQTKIEEIYSK
ncbi:MAG TPA: sugar ABC transporter substrate-binding protein [Firmicutes bacterium]|jgi:multiple sugar transport system substrate-binding protein|nr:sugar ABC transporter substrate-binding protein [Bacillota bacterium]